MVAPDAPWWQGAGDPLLAQLIAQGLSQDAALICRADALAARETKAHARKIKARLTRLVGPQDSVPDRAVDGYALAAARGRTAARIALAYIEARRWQERIALRAQALEPLRDNADIARFRREAGLVSALDGDMADLMTGLEDASVEAAREHLSNAIADLARLTGALPDDLRVLLGPDGAVPMFTLNPAEGDLTHRADLMALQIRLTTDLAHRKVTQQALDKQLAATDHDAAETPDVKATALKAADAEALNRAIAQWRKAETIAQDDLRASQDAQNTANSRLAPLTQNEALATRAVSDARLAYRGGTDSFAMLYVAEGAALAARERRIDADAALAAAAIAVWRAQGLDWQASDLAPTSSGNACVQP